MVKTLIIIPTYNELENIESIVSRVIASVPDASVLIVDDSSPDGTGERADALAARLAEVDVLHRSEKNGLGAAYLAGFRWGLARGFERFVQLDADGSHQPEQLPRLLDAADHADIVVGSRWVPGGQVENWPWHRLALSRGGSLYSRLALGLRQQDVTGGYRVYSASALRAMDLSSVESLGYCFQIDMLLHGVRANLSVVEVPITFIERVHGTSKMNGVIVVEAMARVTLWGVGRLGRLGRATRTPSRESASADRRIDV